MSDFDWTAWRAAVKRNTDLRDLIGTVVKLSGGAVGEGLCPFHGERTPSFKVWGDHYHCYGCGAHGDIFTWLESVPGGGLGKQQVLREAARLSGLETPSASGNAAPTRVSPAPIDTAPINTSPINASLEPRAPKPVPEWVEEFSRQCHAALLRAETGISEQVWRYLDSRGLSDVAIDLRFGAVDTSVKLPAMGAKLEALRGRLVLPTLVDGRAVFFKARYIAQSDADMKRAGIVKYDGPPGQVPAPFNAGALEIASARGFVLLTEGETDAASVLAACGSDYPVLGLPGGRLPQGWDVRLAQSGLRIYTLMDGDEAGQRHGAQLKTTLEARALRVSALQLAGHADINAALVDLGADGLRHQLEELRFAVDAAAVSDWEYIRSKFLDEADARFNRPHHSYSTGIPLLDTTLDGGFAEGLHVLGGITGGGKTSLSLSIALHNALAGRSVLYASFEQSRYELWARIASRMTHVAQGVIKRGAFKHDDGSSEPASGLLRASNQWGAVEQVAKHLRILEGGDALSRVQGAWSIDAVRQAAETMSQANGAPPLVIVDYLQRVPGPPDVRLSDARERVSYVAGALQVRLARELGCPVLALSSISRASYRLAEGDLESRLAAFKEAGELEYTAYTATLLYGVPKDHHDALGFSAPRFLGAKVETPIAIDVVKNREGTRARVIAAWRGNGDHWQERGVWPEGGLPQIIKPQSSFVK